jgi:glycosyltransferase involved in cell wall biosynthesis
MLEAMACGCAVITSRHTNAADLIQDGVNGFTVPYGDVAGYLNLTERLLVDEPLRQRIVKEGFKTVSRLTWEYAANRMEEILFKFESFNTILPTNKA